MKPMVIEKLYAFVAENDPNVGEGLAGLWDPLQNTWVPAIGADKERIESLRPIIQMMATETGRPIKLIEYSVRREVEVVKP